jgi:DnaK suppressor protein
VRFWPLAEGKIKMVTNLLLEKVADLSSFNSAASINGDILVSLPIDPKFGIPFAKHRRNRVDSIKEVEPMAKRDALLRLYKSLKARRDALRGRLGDAMRDLRGSLARQGGDIGELACESGSEELSSNLAELEARELNQIEAALSRLRQGTYGACESCGKKIPLARLNALPFSITCVQCQRAMEIGGSWAGQNTSRTDWDRVRRFQPLEDQPVIDLTRLELELSTTER